MVDQTTLLVAYSEEYKLRRTHKKSRKKCRAANLKDATGSARVQDNYRNEILKTDNADANEDAKCEQ
jgi:hypothetical protein